MPVTSVTTDPGTLTLMLVADFGVPQQRLWEAFADPRQLERAWKPTALPSVDALLAGDNAPDAATAV